MTTRNTIAVCTAALFTALDAEQITDADLVDGLEHLAVWEVSG